MFHVKLKYNTNFSQMTYKDIDVMREWDKFENIEIGNYHVMAFGRFFLEIMHVGTVVFIFRLLSKKIIMLSTV